MPKPVDFALVAGVNKYKHPYYQTLRGAARDAVDFATWLASPTGANLPASNVELHLDGTRIALPHGLERRDATREAISESFHRLAQKGGRRLYIYLAGHGVTGPTFQSCLLTADHLTTWHKYVEGRLLANIGLTSGKFDEVLLVMDCCRDYNEGLDPWTPGFHFKVDDEAQQRGVYAYGAKLNRQTHERKFGPVYHGVFTWVLMRGLQGSAADVKGQVTAKRLERYAKWKVNSLEPGQEPTIEVDQDLVLATGLTPTPDVKLIVRTPTGVDDFQVRDGFDLAKSLAVEKRRLSPREWEVKVPPLNSYVIVAQPHGRWFKREKPVRAVDEESIRVDL